MLDSWTYCSVNDIRSSLRLNYTKLFQNGSIRVEPRNDFEVVHDVQIEYFYKHQQMDNPNVFWTPTRECRKNEKFKYYGQVNRETKKPEGLFIAVSKTGAVLEGCFESGKLKSPYLIHALSDYYKNVVITSNDGGLSYRIVYQGSEFRSAFVEDSSSGAALEVVY